MSPDISVVMSVYNAPLQFLAESITSILTQTFKNFEFIIIDDGSNFEVKKVLNEFNSQDSRIRLLQNDQNIGLTKSLNKGIEVANGKWIARQDADDISLPLRFEKQINYLSLHPELGLLGTGYGIMEHEQITPITNYQPVENLLLKWQLLFHNAFCHTSVCVRSDLLKQYSYDTAYLSCQDYDCWIRIMQRTEGSNLREKLVFYRKHKETVSDQRFSEQQAYANQISAAEIYRVCGMRLKDQDITELRRRYVSLYLKTIDLHDDYLPLFLKIWDQFVLYHKLDTETINSLFPFMKRCMKP